MLVVLSTLNSEEPKKYVFKLIFLATSNPRIDQVSLQKNIMLCRYWHNHYRMFASLAFVHRNSISEHNFIKFCIIVVDGFLSDLVLKFNCNGSVDVIYFLDFSYTAVVNIFFIVDSYRKRTSVS